jgi:hypothetical protein
VGVGWPGGLGGARGVVGKGVGVGVGGVWDVVGGLGLGLAEARSHWKARCRCYQARQLQSPQRQQQQRQRRRVAGGARVAAAERRKHGHELLSQCPLELVSRVRCARKGFAKASHAWTAQ